MRQASVAGSSRPRRPASPNGDHAEPPPTSSRSKQKASHPSATASTSTGAASSSPTKNGHSRTAEDRRRRRERETLPQTAEERIAFEEESRRVRNDYRELQAQAEDAKKNLASHKPEDLVRLLGASEELYERVKDPNDALLDSKFLLNVSEMGAQMLKTTKLDGGAFDIDDYVSRLARFIGGEAAPVQRAIGTRTGTSTYHAGSDDDDGNEDIELWDWEKLGRTAASYSRRAPALDFLLGPLLIEQKTRKTVQRRAAESTTGVRAAPAQIKQTDLQHNKEGDTSIQVRRVAKLLSQHAGEDGISLFRFAINPESFSNTVENLFYISFLIKEGKAKLFDDKEGMPMLATATPPTDEDTARGLTKKQFVWEFDMALYQDLIETFQIKSSVIPTRHGPETMARARTR